jgi:hypothetical protein
VGIFSVFLANGVWPQQCNNVFGDSSKRLENLTARVEEIPQTTRQSILLISDFEFKVVGFQIESPANRVSSA